MNHSAEYNLHTNFIKFYMGSRLSDEEFQAFRKLGMAYWRGSKCFAGVWTPAREDHILRYVDEVSHIIDDDSGYTYRLERFSRYEGNAQDRADREQARIDYLIEHGPPMGQPILVGHHSERKARKHQKELDSSMRRSIFEQDKADYWQSRQERAGAARAYKEQPGVIKRRIEGLEKQVRDSQRAMAE